MTSVIEVEGYRAVVRYDADLGMYRGEFVGLNGGADFYAEDMARLRDEAATSEWTAPARSLAAPDEDVMARVVVNDFGVHLEFTVPPNLVGGQTNDGYDTHYLRGRWDGVPVSSFMVDQRWGETSLHFYADKKKVRRIPRHDTLSVAMDWYGAGSAAWNFSLAGASEALEEAVGAKR